MTFFALLLIGFSLAMDAFAISVSNGIAYHGERKHVFLTAVCFGIAQAIMPAFGYLLGSSIKSIIESVDHWVAFGLLLIIGGKMLWESCRELRSLLPPTPKPLTWRMLIVQSVATSIDALAVGIGFAALDVDLLLSCLVIGIVTLICCVIGGLLGQRFGFLLQRYAGILGGVILIGIGVKILLEHLCIF